MLPCGLRLGLNKLFFFSSLLFYSFMLVVSTYNSFDYIHLLLFKKMFKNVVRIIIIIHTKIHRLLYCNITDSPRVKMFASVQKH